MPFIHLHTDCATAAYHPSINLDGVWTLKLLDGSYLVTSRYPHFGTGRHLIAQTFRDEMPKHVARVLPSIRSGSKVSPEAHESLAQHLGLEAEESNTATILEALYQLTGDPIYSAEDTA